MNNTSISKAIENYKVQERNSHVLLDDVLNKASQEVGEFLEAVRDENSNEMKAEAADSLVNIYSAVHEMGIDTDVLIDGTELKRSTEILDIAILHSKWNQIFQGLRGRYSRGNYRLSDLESVSKDLISSIIHCADLDIGISEVIKNNTEKFRSRIEQYIPQIDIKEYIRECENFPIEGISFKDISPILSSPVAFRHVCMEMVKQCQNAEVIVGLDARGFLFGASVAEKLGVPFVMARKKGKLPGETIEQDYGLEYGNDCIEIQQDAISPGQKVAIIDDLLATGGTAKAAIQLVEKLGGKVENLSFIISLDEQDLRNTSNRKYLEEYASQSLVQYQ